MALLKYTSHLFSLIFSLQEALCPFNITISLSPQKLKLR